MEQKERIHERAINWVRYSISLRMAVIAVITLILLIPLSYIQELINERQLRQESVINEVNEKWGDEVLLYGPVLVLPYKQYIQVSKTNPNTNETIIEKQQVLRNLYVFPDELNIKSNLEPFKKKRGLYNTIVFNGKSKLDGFYLLPDLEAVDVSVENILWEKAMIMIQTSNLKGINNDVKVNIKDQEFSFLPKYSKRTNNTYSADYINLHSLESKSIHLEGPDDLEKLKFSLDMDFNGSKQLRFIPIGRITDVKISSTWKSPSFIGEYLPYNEDKINEEGFDAKWNILNINRGFGQIFQDELPILTNYSFGVNLMFPVDEYQQSMRSAKYGFLVIALTFLLFFLIQIISKIHIHPFQYLMIGLALTIFYTLLISISEHSSFLISYIISGVSVISLITLYSKSILKDMKFTLLIGLSLSALYSFIFVIIQLENYALIVGSIGLFIILAIVMYVSRSIDWDFRKNE